MEPEGAEAGARDAGPRRHGACIEVEHGEGFHGEHVPGQPRAAGEAEGELGEAVLGGIVEDRAEGRGRDGAVRGEGEAAEDERRGDPQRGLGVGFVEGERVDAFEEPGDLLAEVAGHGGERDGGAGRDAGEDAAEEVLVEVGKAVGTLPGRGRGVTAAALARAAAHRVRRGDSEETGTEGFGLAVGWIRVRERCRLAWADYISP